MKINNAFGFFLSVDIEIIASHARIEIAVYLAFVSMYYTELSLNFLLFYQFF